MSAILKIFLQNERAIRRFLSRRISRAQDLEDQVQETFLRGFAAEMKREIAEPKAYLFQVARNIALEARRKEARAPTDNLEDSGGADLLLDEDQAATEDWLDGRRKLALFTRAVAELPPQCRRAFLLRRVEGLAYKQIANRMNISVSAVEKHVTAGLLKCRAYLRAQGYDPSEFGAGKQLEASDAASENMDAKATDPS